MKVVIPSKKPNIVPPPIPFEKVEKTLQKGEYTTIKLRTNGADPQSATREITVPYFKDGKPEDLLIFLKLFDQIVDGHNMTTGPQKYSAMRSLLQGNALSWFNHKATELGNETNASFETLKKFLIAQLFPRRALRMQKRYIRRHLRKPRDVTIRNTHTRVVELNDYLSFFPNGQTDPNGIPLGFTDDQKLDVDEIADILELGCPGSWQKKMIAHGFDPVDQDAPIDSLVEFCERLETLETMEGQLNPNQTRTNNTSQRNTASNKRSKNENGSNRSHFNAQKTCRLHGPGHSTAECKVLGSVADELKSSKENQSSDYGKRTQYAAKYQRDTNKQIKALISSQKQMFAAFKSLTDKSKSSRKRTKDVLAALEEPETPSDEESVISNAGSELCAAFQQQFDQLSVDSDADEDTH